MSIENNKLMNLADGKVLYDDLRGRVDEKQNAPTVTGTAGQVLSLDSNLAPVWADQTGGSADDKAPVIISSASGAIASFSDGAEGMPLKSLSVSENATKLTVCGKNFFNKDSHDEISAISPVYNSSGEQTSGTKSGFRYRLPPGTYTLHIEVLQSTYTYVNVQDSQYRFKQYASLSTTSIQSAKTITIEEGDILVVYRGNTYALSIDGSKLQIELGTVGTTTEEYTGKTYTITDGEPDETVTTLKGKNNIFADVGNVSVSYCADTKTYVDGSIPSVPVTDVQINGTTILSNGVANIPLVANNAIGIPKVNNTYGVTAASDGTLMMYKASDAQIKTGTESYRGIAPASQHTSVFYGLAKAASDTSQASSSNAVGTYTDPAKAAIQHMIGTDTIIAPQETANSGASQAYAVGDLFTMNGKLYKATSAIAVNGTIIPGTNCAETSVSEDVSELKSAIVQNSIEENLLRDELPGTSTTVTIDSNGNPTSIVHTANSETVRTDMFVWGTGTVTETRTLANGKSITITTNLETLAQTISAVQEVA